MIFEELNTTLSEKKLKKIVENWWRIYENDSKNALEELSMVLFLSGGIKPDTFNIAGFPDDHLKELIFSVTTNIYNVPIFDKRFSGLYKSFLDQLFQKNDWAVLRSESFINPLLNVIKVLNTSPWDSLRAVSFMSGMKIMRHSYQFHNNHSYSNKSALYRRIERLQNDLHSVFRYNLRDRSPYLRSIPFTELISWSKENPEIIIEDNISKYILRGMVDLFKENRILSLRLLFIAFMKPLVIDKQQNLFKDLIPNLIMFLRTNEESNVLSLKIMNHALRFLDVKIDTYEDLNLSMCLYDKHESVIEEAKLYFYSAHLKDKSGVDILIETVNFYKKCPIKSASILVHHLFPYFIVHTCWQDWEKCLNLSDDINDHLHILFEYISILNADSANSGEILDSLTVAKMKDDFTVYFSKYWIQLINSDKVVMNSGSLVTMFKLVTMFNGSKLFQKTHTEIIKKSINLFHRTQSVEVLKECLLCIQFLNSFNENGEIEETLISRIITEFIEALNSENEELELFNLSHYKVVLVIKKYKCDYEPLWTHVMIAFERSQEIHRIEIIISVLYHLLMKNVKDYIEFISDLKNGKRDSVIKENSVQVFLLESRISSHSTVVFQAAAAFMHTLIHVNENSSLLKQLVIPKIFEKLICLSRYIFLSRFSFQFNDQQIESYILFCTRIMNMDCSKNGSAVNPCCELLRNFVKSTIEGHLCVTYLKYFIMKLEMINSHFLIILDIFYHFVKIQNPIGAFVLTNGLINFYNENKSKHVNDETIKEKIKEIYTFILKHVKDLESKYYQQTGLNLYLYLNKLITEGYIIFSDIAEIVKSSLCIEIKNKLSEETVT